MPLNAKDIVEILRTLDELGYQRFRLEQGDVSLEVDATAGGGIPPQPVTEAPPRPEPNEETAEETPAPASPITSNAAPPREGLVSVDSPMTGTFYRSPSPGTPPFVEVGSVVAADETVCLVDVMKLFNSIPAGIAGTVIEICAENETQVKAGQPLMWIEPAG